MLWVVVFVGIAVAGLVMVGCYAVWLAHKTSDVLSELGVLADQAGRLAELAGEITMSPAPGARARVGHAATVDRIRSDRQAT